VTEIDAPILYGDPSHKSIINPDDWIKYLHKVKGTSPPKLPDYCILSFKYTRAAKYLIDDYRADLLEFFGKDREIYIFKYKGTPMCFTYLGVGAPLAGMMFEEIVPLGVKYAILFGGVGSLKPDIKRWTLIVPDKAIRDEGTSYHYNRPSLYSYPSPLLLRILEKVLKDEGTEYIKGAVWTTDAPYRETIEKRREFMRLGAVCVDMEASALFTIANFRKVHLAAIFYAGDLVTEEGWDARIERDHKRKLEEVVKDILKYSMETLHRVHSTASDNE